MSHALLVEDDNGELIDVIAVCSDSCHRDLAAKLGMEYQGWYGAQEVEFTDYCQSCGVVIPGFNPECEEQATNVVVNRFRTEGGEKCVSHNEHWIQLPSTYLE